MVEKGAPTPAEALRPEISCVRIVDGLGFGEGSISRASQEDAAGNADLAAVTDAALASPDLLVRVSADETGAPLDDDGCGDGRAVGIVFRGQEQVGRSLNRAKVFGGGCTMRAAQRIGAGQAIGRTVQQTMSDSMGDLARAGVDFGAHTDNHAEGPNCGCGAVDKAPIILGATAKYRTQISGAIRALGVPAEGLDGILDNFAAYATEVAGQDYSGRAVMDEIIGNGKIVKQLQDSHLETRIVLNMVEGYTVDQEFIRQQTGGRAQVFAVDVWRLVKLANAMHPTDVSLAHQALLSELVYTLATAAVLTKGDLPVYAVSHATQAVAV